jgi:acetolactate synthase I/II/III large subunit
MPEPEPLHGGAAAVAAARHAGAGPLFTLSGGHVFPVYDGAVHAVPPMRIVDVRHEQTAVFAAEATGRLCRVPGFAVLTAGPGVTNGISGVTTAHFNGSPLVVLAGRAPDARWGSGSLQELDHPALLAPVTKRAWTVHDPAAVGPGVAQAFRLAATPHRGPVFVDASLEALFGPAGAGYDRSGAGYERSGAGYERSGAGYERSGAALAGGGHDPGYGPSGAAGSRPPGGAGSEAGPAWPEPDPAQISRLATLLGEAARPVLVLGSDVWLGGADEAARAAAVELRLPVVANGQVRGIFGPEHELLVTRARPAAFAAADLVIVAGTALDFRLGYGRFGGAGGSPGARVAHIADSPEQLATHCELAGSASGDLTACFTALADAFGASGRKPRWDADWVPGLAAESRAARAADAALLSSDSCPIHPMRVYGELAGLLDADAVVIGDGGDFVSYAGKHVEPRRPGGWLDPGPYGCLGTGLGYAIAARIARPAAQVVLLLGDGAAGFSLMDADTLVRHRLPVVIICGNNGIWGLEKHPMRALYGYDVAADLQPQCRYDQVVTALGGAGELVTRAGEIGPALRRAFAAGVPYLVNIATDPEVAYPRSTTGV